MRGSPQAPGLWEFLIYLALVEVLEEKDLYMYLEPELTEFERTFDYAIVDERSGFMAMLVEVKRLSSIQNLPEYGESFIEKIQDLLNRYQSCRKFALQLHIAKAAMVGGETDLGRFEIFVETVSRMVRKITEKRIEVFLTPGHKGFGRFKEALEKGVREVLDRVSTGSLR